MTSTRNCDTMRQEVEIGISMADRTKILIVDDEPINLDFFDVMLSKLGFAVEKAEDGEEALDRVRSFEPDLLLLDNIMPKLSGWEVTRIIKNSEEYEDYRDVPIIMFSAMDDVKDKVEGFELGIEDYIIKPFNFSEVLARIRAVLRSRTLSRQVVAKERRIALMESLNKSLIYFTRHLKEPVVGLKEAADRLDADDCDATREFVAQVQKESEEVLAAVSGLENEITELELRGPDEENEGLTLQDLEEKFQKHFMNLDPGKKNEGGVRK